MIAEGIGRYVFSRGGYAAVEVDEDIREQRRACCVSFPNPATSASTKPGRSRSDTVPAHELFPDANSSQRFVARSLKSAQANASRLGVPAIFKQGRPPHRRA